MGLCRQEGQLLLVTYSEYRCYASGGMEVAGPAEITQGLHSNTATRTWEAGTESLWWTEDVSQKALLRIICPDKTKVCNIY